MVTPQDWAPYSTLEDAARVYLTARLIRQINAASGEQGGIPTPLAVAGPPSQQTNTYPLAYMVIGFS